MKFERMRASTVPCRYIYIYLYISISILSAFWHRCGRRFGRPSFGFWFAIWVRYSVATVLRDQRCIRDPVSLCFPLAGLSAKSPQVFPSVRASFARRVMGRVRDSSVTRDASFLARSCGGVCVAHQMVRQLAQDVDPAEAAQARASPGGMP